jgi:hypothetical protein
MPNQIEEAATKILIKFLTKNGFKVQKSDNKTFDLIINGKHAEVKGKGNCFEKLDFVSLTENQFKEAHKKDFDIYLVCGIAKKETKKKPLTESSHLR